MVQVDVIWSYAFGASYAAASCQQLAGEREAFNNPVYMRLLVFLGVFFAPSGLYLLWQFPQWETMQVAREHADLPPWLVTIFGVTNITQGILGYWIGWRFTRQRQFFKAHLNWMLSWVLFWFVLVNGWDTTGWQRFLYDRQLNGGELWSPGRHNDLAFFTGPVFQSLFVMGVMFIPVLGRHLFEPNYLANLQLDSTLKGGLAYRLRISLRYLGTMFGVALALAIVASLIVRGCVQATEHMVFGTVLGLLISGVAGYFVAVRRGGLFYRLAKPLFVSEP